MSAVWLCFLKRIKWALLIPTFIVSFIVIDVVLTRWVTRVAQRTWPMPLGYMLMGFVLLVAVLVGIYFVAGLIGGVSEFITWLKNQWKLAKNDARNN